MAGTVSQAAFCVAYARMAMRARWPAAVLAGSIAFALATLGLRWLPLALVPLAAIAVLSLLLATRLMPAVAVGPRASVRLSWWDLPARMVVTTVFVVLLTGIASMLGPRLTGLLAPFPLYGAMLCGFTHALEGPARAAGVLRGLLLGLYCFIGFFVVLAALLERTGVVLAFTVAAAVALAIQGVALWILRRHLT